MRALRLSYEPTRGIDELSLRDLAEPKSKRKRFTRILNRKQIRRMKKRGYDAERVLRAQVSELSES